MDYEFASIFPLTYNASPPFVNILPVEPSFVFPNILMALSAALILPYTNNAPVSYVFYDVRLPLICIAGASLSVDSIL